MNWLRAKLLFRNFVLWTLGLCLVVLLGKGITASIEWMVRHELTCVATVVFIVSGAIVGTIVSTPK